MLSSRPTGIMPPKPSKKVATNNSADPAAAVAQAAPALADPILPDGLEFTTDRQAANGPAGNYTLKFGGNMLTVDVGASGFGGYDGRPTTDFGNYAKSPAMFLTGMPGDQGLPRLKAVTPAIALEVKNKTGMYAPIAADVARVLGGSADKLNPISAIHSFRKHFEITTSSGVKVTRFRLAAAIGARGGGGTTLCPGPPNKAWVAGGGDAPIKVNPSGRGSPFFKKSMMGAITLYPRAHFRQTGEVFITWYLYQAVLYAPQGPAPVAEKRGRPPSPTVTAPVMSPRLVQNLKRFKPAAIDAPGDQAGGFAASTAGDDSVFTNWWRLRQQSQCSGHRQPAQIVTRNPYQGL